MTTRRIKPSIIALYVFLALVGLSILVSMLASVFLPDHELHPDNHPLVNLVQRNGRKHAFPVEYRSHASPSSDKTPNYHMVFSTSCSPFQDWQSIIFFYHANKVKQPGTVTRIASGCKESQMNALRTLHEEIITPMSSNFKLHFAPSCSDDRSKYFNKPYGIRDFLEKVLGYPDPSHDDDIIMIVDPDMMLLRPLTHKFDVDRISWVVKDGKKVDSVRHGHPISQAYGFGSNWLTSLNGNISYVAGGDESTPVNKVSLQQAAHYYPAGPPYLATARDMYNIALHWTKFVVNLHDVFPHMMSEMHGYSFAAAHLKLPHQLAFGFMVSDVTIDNKEGWGFLHDVRTDEACVPDAIPIENLPFVFHYCQRYALGRWFIGKYKLPKKFFDCGEPLLREPPLDTPVRYNWWIYPNQKDTANYTKKPFRVLQNGWALCKLITSLNEAVTDFKTKHCPKDKANFTKSFVFHKPELFDAFLQGEVPELRDGSY